MPTDAERHNKAIVLEAFDTLFNQREGDYLMLHGRFSNTGRPVNWIAVDIVRMHDDQLAEH
jgi:hypothetical protein